MKKRSRSDCQRRDQYIRIITLIWTEQKLDATDSWFLPFANQVSTILPKFALFAIFATSVYQL